MKGLDLTDRGAKHDIKSILIGKHNYKGQHILLQQIISGWNTVDTKGYANFLQVQPYLEAPYLQPLSLRVRDPHINSLATSPRAGCTFTLVLIRV